MATKSLPNCRGHTSNAGRRFDGGVDLSGGRVAKKWPWLGGYLRDAQLLILDEPTAALDARSEF